MDRIVTALAAQHDELEELISGLDEVGWQADSRCDGWTVCDVVLHLAQTDEAAIASLHDQFAELTERASAGDPPPATVDEAAARAVERERGEAGPAVLERWRANARSLRDELRASDARRRVQWVAGDMSARTLATTRLAEAWIHTGDVAFAFGREPAADDRLWHIARLAWRTLPYAFARSGRELHGPVAFVLRAPDGADTWRFEPEGEPRTVIEGSALELCTVAGQRARAPDTRLRGDGPDADAVLELVRTFA